MGIFGKPKSGSALGRLPDKKPSNGERLCWGFRLRIEGHGMRAVRNMPVPTLYTFTHGVYVNTCSTIFRRVRQPIDPARS